MRARVAMSHNAAAARSLQPGVETDDPCAGRGRSGSPWAWRRRFAQTAADARFVAVLVSLALHALVFALAGAGAPEARREPPATQREPGILVLAVLPAPPKAAPAAPAGPPRAPAPRPEPAAQESQRSEAKPAAPEPAFMPAPPAPTAQDWALAGQYTLKNSKRYRYTWGQQVRSMMGPAVAGPGQGMVRFQVEIAPDGRLARLETLWSTSSLAEQLARKAIEGLPPLPPTPTGKPLIFEKTIAFEPWASEGPPIYANDCLPDPPAYRNPYAWDGRSPPARAEPAPTPSVDPKALADCLRQLPQDSVDAEGAHDQRQLDQWDSPRLGR